MAIMTDSDMFAAMNITGTPTATAETVPKVSPSILYYLRDEMKTVNPEKDKDYNLQQWRIVGVMMMIKDFSGADKFTAKSFTVAATSDITPVDPDATTPGNLTTPWFYVMQNTVNNAVKYWVHQSQLM